MRPELPTAVAVDNSASIQPARSIFISWGKSVQISGATSLESVIAAVKNGELDVQIEAVSVKLRDGFKK